MHKVKFDIVSGFLGAGKTTFIKKLMKDIFIKENIVILENEFGRVNIDQDTLEREGIAVKSIQAGCICCSSANNLSGSIMEIIEEYHPDRIVIEPTGVAKLSDVKTLLQKNSELNTMCEMDHVITIVDVRNYYQRVLVSKDFFENQIRSSDVIFLSKVTQTTPEHQEEVTQAIHEIQPRCHVISEAWEEIQTERLKQMIEFKQNSIMEKQPIRLVKNHKNDFESYEIVTDQPININFIKDLFAQMESGQYGEIHRVKGICKDNKEGWYSVEAVPGEITCTPFASTLDNKEELRVCIIGRNLEKNQLEKAFLS